MFFIVLCFSTSLVLGQINNVCKNYRDYATLRTNPNCWYNPDVDASAGEIVKRNGFPFEFYNVTTEDDYILGLFRIPHNYKNVDAIRQPIYLHHALAVSSNYWFDHGNRSLALALSNQGYDVWVGNTRGNRYSSKHLKYTIEDQQFWNFSWDEVALYDLPANLDLINRITGQKVIYIGHSMGSTISYVFSIDKKEEAHNYLKGVISLAPAVFFTSTKTPIKIFAPFINIIKEFAETFNKRGVFRNVPLQQMFNKWTCNSYPLILFCDFFVHAFFGVDSGQMQAQDLPLLLSGAPDGTSIYTILHFVQEYNNHGRFQRYDFGSTQNLKNFDSRKPPQYDLSVIDFCVHLFYGDNDFLVDPKDVMLLHENLKCSKLHKIAPNNDPAFNHIDFAYGKDVENKFYPYLFRSIRDIVENHN